MTQEELKTNIIKEKTKIINKIVNISVISRQLGAGTILRIVKLDKYSADLDFIAEIKFESCEKNSYLYLTTSIKKNALTIDSQSYDIINNSYNLINSMYTRYKKIMSNNQQTEKQKMLQMTDEEKAECRFRKHVEKTLKKLNELKNTVIDSTQTSLYESIGWLAKNVVSIRAIVPDFANSWFCETFGENAEHTVVDSSRKTSGGYPMKWNTSLYLRLRSVENLPKYVERYMSSKGTCEIYSNELVFTLILKFGFSFGKNQNIDKIRSLIPNEHRLEFEQYYSM